MLIVSDLPGIQDFVFAVPEEESGQARMLRARSFHVQALSELLALAEISTEERPRCPVLTRAIRR